MSLVWCRHLLNLRRLATLFRDLLIEVNVGYDEGTTCGGVQVPVTQGKSMEGHQCAIVTERYGYCGR